MRETRPDAASTDQVTCPNCCNHFAATPINVQRELSALKQSLAEQQQAWDGIERRLPAILRNQAI